MPVERGKRLLNLPECCRLPNLNAMDGVSQFGDVRLAWNDQGIAVQVTVGGRRHPVTADASAPTESDGLQVWIDTRDTQTIHRASRFCHQFCLLPAGAGRKKAEPVAVQVPIARAREETRPAASSQIPIRCRVDSQGYELECWLPAEVLNGFEPELQPRVGFYYYLRDSELGEQFLTVDHEFPFAHDPAMWSTLELTADSV